MYLPVDHHYCVRKMHEEWHVDYVFTTSMILKELFELAYMHVGIVCEFHYVNLTC